LKKISYKDLVGRSYSILEPILKDLLKEFEKSNKKRTSVKMLAGSSVSFFVKALSEFSGNDILVIESDKSKPEDRYHDLQILFGENNVSLLKEPSRSLRTKIDNKENRVDWMIEGLTNFSTDQRALVATDETLMTLLPNPQKLHSNKKILTKDLKLDFDEFVKSLILNGFERRDYVAVPGDISIRGGIVDLYPVGANNPYRIEFWGDEIESLREFDILSQRSIRDLDQIEFIAGLYNSDDEQFEYDIFDYLPKDSIIILYHPDSLEFDESTKQKLEKFRIIEVNPLEKSVYKVKTTSQPSVKASVSILIKELTRLAVNDYKILFCADGDIHLNRFKEIIEKSLGEIDFADFEYSPEIIKNITFKAIRLFDSTFSEGFIWEDLKIACFTEHQVFERNRVRDTRKATGSTSITLKELQELQIGDYVVHEDKGIAVFDGFRQVSMGGSMQDCAKLLFADEDVLYVNLNYIAKISKYAAREGVMPVLSKLGSADWNRKKARTKKRLKDIARDLIKLYAKRKSEKGYAYPEDSLWQKEFEASFIYEDTPDQARATAELKVDMENDSPMDRLICGDVGFGKTEVAIRAAFKAVQSGKQVAVLVPTTILAQQHFMSFRDRLAKYPVNVEVISRFRSASQQKDIVAKNSDGKIDILIGTHRLLSKDIQFRDLGLLIIDEEHRFGVSAKEKLRQFRSTVDTLTLTATPIPRTLNFSLMGARDLSTIETPPRNRVPVSTEIIEWSDEIVTQTIKKEVERGGQVFFVSDRVEDLEKLKSNMNMLMPNFRFASAHGQMKPADLENIMESFIEGKYDVLVSTKIIESGIDIPNANTIIINRAQNFGMAELYQLRGRVGRTNKQAYCYLIIPNSYKLPLNALRRLQAIEEFSELGSGLKLALRDLEIRGAGNLLGAEQSGFIIDIGFELFQKVLDEAVTELKYEEFSDIFGDKTEKPKFYTQDIAIEIDSDAFFPEDYIKRDTDRFSYYKKLYNLKSNGELQDLVREITDRYGKLPKQANELIYAVKLRIAAIGSGFSRIIQKGQKLICEFPPNDDSYYYENAFSIVIDYINSLDDCKLNQTKDRLTLEVMIDSRDSGIEFLWKIKKTLETL